MMNSFLFYKHYFYDVFMVSFIPQITSTIVFTNLQNSKTPSGLGKEYILDFIKPLWLSIELDTIFPLYGDTESSKDLWQHRLKPVEVQPLA